MGYGILVSSDDVQLRRETATVSGAAAALRDLAQLLGSNTYPIGDDTSRSVGAWTWAGTAHSSCLVLCEVTDAGVRKLSMTDTPGIDTPSAWVAPPTSAQWNQAEVSLSRGRNLAATAAIAAGVPVDEALFGPDMTASTTTSVWQVHADLLPVRFSDADASSLSLMLKTRRCTPALARSAVLRIGGVSSPLPFGCTVHLVCSGNRVCRPADLTSEEKRSLSASGYPF